MSIVHSLSLADLQQKRGDILSISKQYGVISIKVFGSIVRGEETGESDIDLLITLEKGRSLLDVVGCTLALENLLGHTVDVVTEGSLSPYIRSQVLEEAQLL
jgi:predicted nucleotidyltransferase